MSVTQSEFRAAILDPARPVPAGLTNPDGAQASKRFNIYRNNVVSSLIEALVTAFPALYRQVGDNFFRSMAGIYVRKHPPKSPLMMFYGEDMPAFLETFEPVAKYPYFSDLARLELARRHAYHAADATPISPDALAVAPEALMQSRLTFAPAVQIINSAYALGSIWHHTMESGPKPQPSRAEDILITRPGFDPVVTILPAGAAAFLRALQNGATFSAALMGAPDIDLTKTLGILLTGEAITNISQET